MRTWLTLARRKLESEERDESRHKWGVIEWQTVKIWHIVSRVWPSGDLSSTGSRRYYRVPSNSLKRGPDTEEDKQVLEHNKGVSIHRRTLFICKRRGRPSVRIISLDFPPSSLSMDASALTEDAADREAHRSRFIEFHFTTWMVLRKKYCGNGNHWKFESSVWSWRIKIINKKKNENIIYILKL